MQRKELVCDISASFGKIIPRIITKVTVWDYCCEANIIKKTGANFASNTCTRGRV